MERRRAVIVRHPAARHAVAVERLEALARMHAPSWSISVVDTRGAGDPERLARDAALSGVEAVLACGGDGTLNGVLNGVRDAGTRTLVGLIPAGTANVWSREARIPRDPASALALLERGRVVEADLGLARVRGRERRFLLMCGVGLDAAVVAAVEARPRMKRAFAQGAFVLAGLRALVRTRPVHARIEVDDAITVTERSALLLVAGNTRLYGGVTRLTSAARANDGQLDVVTFEARSGWQGIVDGVRYVARAALARRRGWHAVRAERFAYQRASRLVVRPERSLSVQVDGEQFVPCGPDAALELSVEPQAVRLLIAPGSHPLFDG